MYGRICFSILRALGSDIHSAKFPAQGHSDQLVGQVGIRMGHGGKAVGHPAAGENLSGDACPQQPHGILQAVIPQRVILGGEDQVGTQAAHIMAQFRDGVVPS